MFLELTDREVEMMRLMIERRIAEIGPEIHHTDSREYRKKLAKDEAALKEILNRLELAVAD